MAHNWISCAQVFDCLPVAALVAGDIFCVHGGLSPKLKRPADVDGIKRPCQLLAECGDLLSDLTWSDPNSKIEGAPCCASRELPYCSGVCCDAHASFDICRCGSPMLARPKQDACSPPSYLMFCIIKTDSVGGPTLPCPAHAA